MTFIRKLAAGALVAAATVWAPGAFAQQKPITLGFSQVGGIRYHLFYWAVGIGFRAMPARWPTDGKDR